MDPLDIIVRHSGGSGNSNPLNSIGGAISNTEITSQSVAAPVNVTGITIQRAVNLPAWIDLYSLNSGSERHVGWNGPSGLGNSVIITADGTYTIYSPSGNAADGYIVVDAVYASLPGSYTYDYGLAVTNETENIFPDVTASEASTGDLEYRCVYILNDHPSETIATLNVWVGKQYAGEQDVAIAFDSGGVGASAPVLADGDDSTDILSGLSFVSPSAEGSAISVTTIGPGVAVPLWIRRNIQWPVQNAVANDTFGIAMAAYV